MVKNKLENQPYIELEYTILANGSAVEIQQGNKFIVLTSNNLDKIINELKKERKVNN